MIFIPRPRESPGEVYVEGSKDIPAGVYWEARRMKDVESRMTAAIARGILFRNAAMLLVWTIGLLCDGGLGVRA